MSDDVGELAKRALLQANKSLSDLPKKALLRVAQRAVEKAVFEEEAPKKSDDALDRQAFRKGGFSKAEKRAYAQQKFAEELVTPPKNPPPAWLSDPSLLPKKPPTRAE
jgi:hypothetical protein